MSARGRTRAGGIAETPSSAATSSSSSLLRRSASPARFYLSSTTAATPAVASFRFSNPSTQAKSTPATRKRVCACSPTTHPGSFRCVMHRRMERKQQPQQNGSGGDGASRLSARRSAMVNSLVRIGAVEGGELVRRSLAALIRPSSHHQRRRAAFQPRPSRLSSMSSADPHLEA